MIRKLTILTIGIFALSSMLFALVPSQDAQAQCTERNEYNELINATGCQKYPAGGFTAKSTPVLTASPGSTSAAVVSADSAGTTTGGANSGGASIAFTGAESRVLGYAGAGLIGWVQSHWPLLAARATLT